MKRETILYAGKTGNRAIVTESLARMKQICVDGISKMIKILLLNVQRSLIILLHSFKKNVAVEWPRRRHRGGNGYSNTEVNWDNGRDEFFSKHDTDVIRHKEGDNILKRFITADEAWLYHYDPTIKQQSNEWKHPSSPTPKKAKTVKLASVPNYDQKSSGKPDNGAAWNSLCFGGFLLVVLR
ncbi:hypothetical protein TNCV_1367471 [Trichonephila clavipes]|nr:hypothetical protein TNCV_1367471 [Trichonephila clavipes]